MMSATNGHFSSTLRYVTGFHNDDVLFTAQYHLHLEIFLGNFFLSPGCTMAQAFGRRTSTVEARFHRRPVHVRFFYRNNSTVKRFFPSTSVYSCHYNTTSHRYSSSSTCYCYQKDKREKPVKLSNFNTVLQIREHWMQKYLHPFPFRAAVHVRSHTNQCEVYPVQIGTGIGISRVFCFFLFSIIPAILHTRLHLHVTPLERYKTGTVWLLKKRFSFGSQGAYVCKLLPLFPPSVKAVLYLLLSSAEFSPLRAGFEPWQARMLFVVDKVALGQTFLQLLRFSPVSM